MLDPEICTQTPSHPPQIFHLKSRPQKLGCSLPVPLHQSTGCAEGGTSGLIPVWILFPEHLCSPTTSDLRSLYLSGLFLIFMQICQLPRILSLCVYSCLLSMMLRNVLSPLHRSSQLLFPRLLPAAADHAYNKEELPEEGNALCWPPPALLAPGKYFWLLQWNSLASGKEKILAFFSYGCCNKLPQRWWLRTTQTYYFTVLVVRSLKSVSLKSRY